MEKTEDAFRTISEAAEELDLPQHVLRFWETRFPQIRPLKRGGGRRYYRPDDVELLRAIRHLLYSEGYTIKGVQRMLKERGVRAVLATKRSEARESGSTGCDTLAEAGQPMAPALTYPPTATSHGDPDSDLAENLDGAEAVYETAAPSVARPPVEWPHATTAASVSVASAQPQRLTAPAWTAEQNRKLQAAIVELVECRRILSAANI